MDLKSFLHPKSIAVIGASIEPKKLGYQILYNLKANGFKGKIYPVNPNHKSIEGLKAYPDVNSIKAKVDLIVIVIPPRFVKSEIEKCAQLKIKNFVVISAGFGEYDAAGKAMEEEIKAIAIKHKLNILGPNCLGLINSQVNLNATFVKAKNKIGRVAFVSQSGAICAAALDWAADKSVGFSKFVSLGNKTVLNENDFLEYFIKDKDTDLVIAYLESITEGEEFMNVVSRLSRVKPVAVLRGGTSKSGQKAAMSHTGSMAGSEVVIEAALKRAGAIVLDDMAEMFDLMMVFNKKVTVKNDKVYVVSNAGGPMVAAVDQIEKQGLELGEFNSKQIAALTKILPPLAHAKNPLDLVGDAPETRYEESLKVVLADKNIFNVLILLTPQSATEIEKTAATIVSLRKKYIDKNIFTSFIGGASLTRAKEIFVKGGIVNFDFPNEAVRVMGLLINYYNSGRKAKIYPVTKKKDKVARLRLSSGAAKQMDYLESIKLLEKYKINAAKTVKVMKEGDLEGLKYPIAMKVSGENLIHKSEAGAIALNIKDKFTASEQLEKFASLLKDKSNFCLAQEMVAHGTEMILGFKRDQSFGPMILVGAGGIYAEIMKDSQLEVADVDYNRAVKMVEKLKIYPILNGARGKEKADIKSLAQAIVKMAQIAKEHPEITEMDINPLFVNKQGAVAADVRIIKN